MARSFGLGMELFAKANAQASFAGVTLGVHIGRLR